MLEEEESRWLIEELDKVRHEKKIETEVHVPPGCFHTRYFNPLLFPSSHMPIQASVEHVRRAWLYLSNGMLFLVLNLKR